MLASTFLFAQNAEQNVADAERLIKALEIRAGSVVGEIGAGDGALTLAVAKAVGATGRVIQQRSSTGTSLADVDRQGRRTRAERDHRHVA